LILIIARIKADPICSRQKRKEYLKAVLRIHDIMVWILIRICGSMLLTNGSGSWYFRHWPSSFSAYYRVLFEGTLLHLHHFSKKKVKKKSQSNQGFFTIFDWW